MAMTKTARKGYIRSLPVRVEKGFEQAMKVWKTGAERQDWIGDVSYQALELVHSGAGAAIRSLGRLEKATLPPRRPSAHRGHGNLPPVTARLPREKTAPKLSRPKAPAVKTAGAAKAA